MTKKKAQKRHVRERMAKTGESYQSARRAVVADAPAPSEPVVVPAVAEEPERWGLRMGAAELGLPDEPFVIGRNNSCALMIDHPLVSRRHLTLRVSNAGVMVEDHGSRNGTYHNGIQIKTSAVAVVGDTIRIADTEMTVVRTRRPVPDGAIRSAPHPAGQTTTVILPGAARVPAIPTGPGLASPPLVGSTLAGRYRLARTLKTTPPWMMYAATHVVIGAPMTVKLLPADVARESPHLRAWLLREARALQKASHPQVQRVFDIVETDANDAFLVLDEVPDQTLSERLAADGPSEGLALDVGGQLAEILVRMHASGVVHRDLGNDIVYVERGSRRIRLTSFSLASIEDEPKLPIAGTVLGQNVWSAPELLRGEEGDPRSDLYSLGVILTMLIRGSLPTTKPTTKAIKSPLGAIVAKLLEPDPDKRYAAATEVAEALKRLSPSA